MNKNLALQITGLKCFAFLQHNGVENYAIQEIDPDIKKQPGKPIIAFYFPRDAHVILTRPDYFESIEKTLQEVLMLVKIIDQTNDNNFGTVVGNAYCKICCRVLPDDVRHCTISDCPHR